MTQHVFVTGGTGFVGSAVIDDLLARNITVHALSREADVRPGVAAVHTIRGDLFDAAALDSGMRDCDAVIHLVGIIMENPARGSTFERIHVEGTRSVLAAATRNGIHRYIHMSALGTRPGAKSTYHRTKYAAEELVRASALKWTIIRPSMIHGPRGDFMRMEAMWARRKAPPPVFFRPFMPYFGAGFLGRGGAGKLQPVFVNDVARAIVDCLENAASEREIYPLGGGEQLTWPQLHQAVAEAVIGHRRWVVPIPVWKANLLARIGIGKFLGFNRDQVIMSQEDNVCDLGKFVRDFKWQPEPFQTSLLHYARQL
jgi:nucleoside-diphosphate-sugar epimerase